jgi:hypothetical protein
MMGTLRFGVFAYLPPIPRLQSYKNGRLNFLFF